MTGANGFVGHAVCRALSGRGHVVTGLVRRGEVESDGVRTWRHDVADFSGLREAWPKDYSPECVVHLAGRVHVMRDDAPDIQAAFNATNVDGALRVAQAAHARGVRRLVFVSSIKAVAETDGGMPLDESTPLAPLDAYGRSKREAEERLRRFAEETGLELVVVRPPLVYGPGVGANFLQMMNVLWRRLPLPLGAVDVRRSLLFNDNLASALMHCATDARAANSCFHVTDGEDLSVTELLRELGCHLSKPARLFPVAPSLLRVAGTLTGRVAQIERLTMSLRVDSSHIGERLDWRPPFSVEEGLAATASWYRATH